MVDGVENIQYWMWVIKFNFKQSVVMCGYGCVDIFVVVQQQFCVWFWCFRSVNMCQDVFIIEYMFDQYFYFVVVGFMVKELCWDYVGIIEDQ